MVAVSGSVKMYTVTELAQAARVSKMTIYRLIHAGKVDSVRVGRGFRIPEPAAQKMLHITETAE